MTTTLGNLEWAATHTIEIAGRKKSCPKILQAGFRIFNRKYLLHQLTGCLQVIGHSNFVVQSAYNQVSTCLQPT